jgi:hypothetical protein
MSLHNEQETPKEDQALSDIVVLYSAGVENN